MTTLPEAENKDELADIWGDFTEVAPESLRPVEVPVQPEPENRILNALKASVLGGTLPCFILLAYTTWVILGFGQFFALLGALGFSALLTPLLRALVWPRSLKKPWFSLLGATALAGFWGILAAQVPDFLAAKAFEPNNWRHRWDGPEFWLFRASELQDGLEAYYQIPMVAGHLIVAGALLGLVLFTSGRSYWLEPKIPRRRTRILALILLVVLPLGALIYGSYRSQTTPEMSDWLATTKEVRNRLVRVPGSRMLTVADFKPLEKAQKVSEGERQQNHVQNLLELTEYPFQFEEGLDPFRLVGHLHYARKAYPDSEILLLTRISEILHDHGNSYLSADFLQKYANAPSSDRDLDLAARAFQALAARAREPQVRQDLEILEGLAPYRFGETEYRFVRPLKVFGAELEWSPTKLFYGLTQRTVLEAYFQHRAKLEQMSKPEQQAYLHEHMERLRASKRVSWELVVVRGFQNLQISPRPALQTAELMLALRLYRRENGTWPENLEQLPQTSLQNFELKAWDWEPRGEKEDSGTLKLRDGAQLGSTSRQVWVVEP